MNRSIILAVQFLALQVWFSAAQAEDAPQPDAARGDALAAEYFRLETARLTNSIFDGVETLDDWEAKRGEYRRQLLEMLGLDPLPEKTPLETAVTGTVEHDEFTVEKLHYQSRPGLYVTGNLYIPREREGPLPAVRRRSELQKFAMRRSSR